MPPSLYVEKRRWFNQTPETAVYVKQTSSQSVNDCAPKPLGSCGLCGLHSLFRGAFAIPIHLKS